MTLLLPRAKSSHYLKLFLCALLACPPNLPSLERETPSADLEPGPVASSPGRPKLTLRKLDRKALRPHADWTVDADEPESPACLDDFRFSPLALPHRPRDLPSLVPAPLDWRPLGPSSPVASSAYYPPLRC